VRLFVEIHRRRRWLRGDRAKSLLHFFEDFFGFEVADEREHGVVRRVVNAEEILNVLNAGGVQVGH
jgi:hypothetical protein